MKRIVPKDFWGDKDNFNSFSNHMLELINVGRNGQISQLHMIDFIKVKKMTWLSPILPHQKRATLLLCVDFLIEHFVCPLIKSFFAIVETTFAKNRLCFFRKRIWHRLMLKEWSEFSKFCRLKPISKSEYESLKKCNMTLGYSRVLFHLKKSSLRSVCNFSAKRNGRSSINDHLKVLFTVLQYEKDQQPSVVGFAVKVSDAIHEHLKNFILNVKEKYGKNKLIFYLTADIKNCFHSINTHILFQLVSKLLKSTYTVHYYRKRIQNGKNNSFRYFQCVHDYEYMKKLNKGNVELLLSTVICRQFLIRTLKSLLDNNVLKFGHRYYVQSKGISQGSIVSSLLCDIFLGSVERHISDRLRIVTDEELVLRQTDDYLIASTNQEAVIIIFEHLISFLEEHGCHFNFSKCRASFAYEHPALNLKMKTQWLSYSGIAINYHTNEISSDFSHYEGLEAKDTISVKLGRNRGQCLKKNLINSINGKLNLILFDKALNSQLVIMKNAMCIFCLCALKFHAYVMCLPRGQRVDKNPLFFLNIIRSLASNVKRKSLLRLKQGVIPQQIQECEFPLLLSVMTSFCNAAFLYKMNKHPSIYGQLIKEVERLHAQDPPCDCSFVKICFNEICLK